MPPQRECVFCKIAQHQAPADIIFENQQVIVLLDKYPKSRGHLQLVPKQHVRWVYDIPDIGAFFTIAVRIIHGIIPVLGANHVTMATYGHGIEHAHLWIIPVYGNSHISGDYEQSSVQVVKDPNLVGLLQSTLAKEVS
jgi:histidine triad (HIT) family protein